jgi:hypothetical protein
VRRHPSLARSFATRPILASSTSYLFLHQAAVARSSNNVHVHGQNGAATGVHVQLCAAPAQSRKLAHLANRPGLEHAPSAARNKVQSYAEDAYDEDDFEDSDRPRRATGLRSIQRGDETHSLDKTAQIAALGEELSMPIELQGIWRDWMGRPKRTL